jgi:hypothetical protein
VRVTCTSPTRARAARAPTTSGTPSGDRRAWRALVATPSAGAASGTSGGGTAAAGCVAPSAGPTVRPWTGSSRPTCACCGRRCGRAPGEASRRTATSDSGKRWPAPSGPAAQVTTPGGTPCGPWWCRSCCCRCGGRVCRSPTSCAVWPGCCSPPAPAPGRGGDRRSPTRRRRPPARTTTCCWPPRWPWSAGRRTTTHCHRFWRGCVRSPSDSRDRSPPRWTCRGATWSGTGPLSSPQPPPPPPHPHPRMGSVDGAGL